MSRTYEYLEMAAYEFLSDGPVFGYQDFMDAAESAFHSVVSQSLNNKENDNA